MLLLPLVLLHRGGGRCAAAIAAVSTTAARAALAVPLQRPSSPLSTRCLSSSSSSPSSTANSPPPITSTFLREDPERRGSALIMDGTAAAAAWEREMAAEVLAIVNGSGDGDASTSTPPPLSSPSRRPPSLAVVLVGDRPDSVLYVTRKLEAAARVGIDARVVRLPETSTEQQVRAAVAAASADETVDGVLVQLPLPPGISEASVLFSLDPWKDVDGFHHVNLGRLAARGRAAAYVPAAALGVVELLRRCGAPLSQQQPPGLSSSSSSSSPPPSLSPAHALVLGDSTTVGVPLAMLLGREGVAATTLCHRPSTAALFDKKEEKGEVERKKGKEKEEENTSRRAAAGACLPTLPGGSGIPVEDEENEVAEAESGSESGGSESDDDEGEASSSAAAALAGAAAGASLSPSSPNSSSPLSSLEALVRSADIVVAALGSPEVVPGEWIKQGAWVVDVGINVLPVEKKPDENLVDENTNSATLLDPTGTRGIDYRVVGDVHPSAFLRARAVSPVPGGVGPMTIAALLANTLRASGLNERRRERRRRAKKSGGLVSSAKEAAAAA